jgi:hypothetical protein
VRTADAAAYFAELGNYERHFNETQSHYRTLTSTWLLGSVAAIGFVLTKKFNVHIDKSLIVAAIGAAGAAGVALLWNLDLIVYHRLLEAVFVAGLRLEKANPEVPRVRALMRQGTGRRGVRPLVAYYYLGTMGALLLVAAASFTVWSTGPFDEWAVVVGLAAVGLVRACIKGMHSRSCKANPLTAELRAG